MLPQLLSHSDAIRRLVDEQYQLDVINGYLVLRDVPYRNANGEVAYCELVEPFSFNNGVLAPPSDHTVHYTGEQPYDANGRLLDVIASSDSVYVSDEIQTKHLLSRKPREGTQLYRDHHHKLTTYAWALSAPAQKINPSVSPSRAYTGGTTDEADPIFRYNDSASTRAGITIASDKLRLNKVAIVGLGGTGSYILDLLAKVPITELHLFDGDKFEQHNAFRAPGAASSDEINAELLKVDYYAERYDPMRTGIIAHPYYLTDANAAELLDMDFVFIAADAGKDKAAIVALLAANQIDFIDSGMGLQEHDGILSGQIRTASVNESNRDMAGDQSHIPTVGADRDEDYDRNIQVADMNMLAAAFAVQRFKKIRQFYADSGDASLSAYTIIDSYIINA